MVRNKIFPEHKRRYVLREYGMVGLMVKKLFQIPNNEMILDIVWNKTTNKLEIKTVLDFEEKSGDI